MAPVFADRPGRVMEIGVSGVRRYKEQPPAGVVFVSFYDEGRISFDEVIELVVAV